MWLPDIDGLVAAGELDATVAAIEAWQLDDGMIPWFPGGHADPWNHTEAAMALTLGGRHAAVERAFEWLRRKQLPTGAWHRYYVADGVEEDKFDANCCAYPAAGLWHHFCCTGDRAFLEAYWPMVERAIDFVLALQTPRGEILWARHADGTPWTFALLTGSSSISHSLRCAIAIASELGKDRPDWQVALGRLLDAIRTAEHEAFAPKTRWAMDWYYPVLTGAIAGDAGRERLAARADVFVLADRGVRCVSDQPWVTAAETCECAMAYLSVGDRDMATRLFRAAQAHRDDDSDHYWTGLVHPQAVTFPDGEQSTYTGAAIVLAADALSGTSPASFLFVDHDRLPGGIVDVRHR